MISAKWVLECDISLVKADDGISTGVSRLGGHPLMNTVKLNDLDRQW